jgi:ATP-dependent DNA helicase Rep
VYELREFGRYVNDLAHRAKATLGETSAREFLREWLKEINYETHLYEGEDSEKLAAARWANVSDFCDWMAARCGSNGGKSIEFGEAAETKSLLDVAQTISLLSTLSEREQDQNVVTLSTLHASKGLEWPHVMLVGATEGMLPFKLGDDDTSDVPAESDETGTTSDSGAFAQRLQEERRLMYVGITRAQRSLAVSWTRRRKKGREMIAAQPSRFIAEMGLDQAAIKEDPRAKLRALREEFARKTKEQKST